MSSFGFDTTPFKLSLVPYSEPVAYPELPLTVFHNLSCSRLTRVSKPWAEICEMLRQPDIISNGKLSAPMIKLATFGEQRNPADQTLEPEKRSLRYGGNLLAVTGIEADYDAGIMPMEEAVKLLEKAGIRALLYSSWGDGLVEPPKYLGGPRWRVIAPFSEALDPSERSRMVARLNGALGGVLADESFTLAQGFFIGARPGGEYQCKVTFRDPMGGRPVDTLDSLDSVAIYKRKATQEDSVDERYTVDIKPGTVIIAPEVYAEIRQALAVIPADCDNFEWFSVLRGLSRLSNRMEAKAMARDWSTSSPNPDHNEATFAKEWDRMTRESTTISHLKIMWLANQYDPTWNKPLQVAELSRDIHLLSLHRKLRSGATEVTPIEYVYDRFMSTGVNIIAGAAGVGKTTLVIPMALAVAHLCPDNHPLKPRIRRNVIIITESVVQVQRTIYSIAQWGFTGMADADFEARVAVLQAHRLDPKELALVAAEYSNWTVDNPKADGSMFKANPLVVLDTANAVLEMENENDNSEVGRAMSIIKIAFGAFPVIIVAHMAKQLGFAESEGTGSRGASAWTGDAQGVYTVFKDGEHPDSPRVLKAHKVRFPTQWPELTFELCSHRERHPNILGDMEEEHFNHSNARPLNPGERAQFKEDGKEQRKQDEWVVLCDEILDLIRTQPEHARSHYERLSKAQGGPGYSQERKERAITSLVGDGCLKMVMLDKPKNRADHYLVVDEEVVRAVNKGRYAI